ncbi:hypothetical protein P7D22_11490 [Lichenihabitans sp. Uapishka_5]|nr:hypothetical protein [Lichenihabitans sp. Uapishka_5]MDX7951792.1 hypothetical protein [Lichenihabitans sp. Uapishka_5]
MTEDGTDADAATCGDHEFEPDSRAECKPCGYCGKVADFELEDAA